MRHVRILVATAAAVALAASPAYGQRQDFDKVTGGGQIIASSDMQGAGDTVGFAALELPRRGDTGQFQYVPTSTGSGTEHWHGLVTCLEVDDNTAVFGGVKTIDGGEEDDLPNFEVFVEDNGPPNGEQGNDMILIRETDEEPDCELDHDEDDELRLARGNLTVHDAA